MIKEIFLNARTRLADIIIPKAKKPTQAAGITGFVDLFNQRYGKMQPTDFYKQIEANESWVYACVAAISESVADADYKLHIQRGDKSDEIIEHPFLDIMNAVNPFMNAHDLRELTEAYQLLTGNAYWYLANNALGVPAEIWIVPSQDMKIVPSKDNFISGYIYEPQGCAPLAFAPEEIVHFKYPNPADLFYGLSPLMAAAYAADIDKYMNIYQASTFQNGALPSGVLQSDQTIQKPEADRIREQWKQLYGGADKAGKIAVLGRGMEFKNITMSAQELAFIASKNVNRDTILGIFRVPKSILGLVEDVNRANAEASEYTFSLRNIQPKLKRFQEKINEKIMPLYKQSGKSYLYIQFENVVPQNRELEITERESRLKNGYSTINEEREKDGLAPVAWGDVPLLPANMFPLGSEPAVPEIPAPEKTASASLTEAEQKAVGILAGQKELVHLGAVAKQKLWTIYKARFDKETYKMNKTMQGLFNGQRKEVLENAVQVLGKAFEKGKAKSTADDIIFDIEFWEKEFIKVAGVDIDAAYTAGVKHGKNAIGSNISFDISNPVAQEYLKDKKFKFSFETNKTTRDQLRGEINEGLKAGESSQQIGSRINKVFDFAEKYRGMRIARTEVGDAENKGSLDVWKATGRVEQKEWMHGGGGENPRPEHVEMNTETVDIEDNFSNGLAYPCDPSADPSEICNCTCSLLPVLKAAE